MTEAPPGVVWWYPLSGSKGTECGERIDAQREALNDQVADRYGPEWRAETERNTTDGRLDAGAEIRDEFTPGALAENLGESAKAAGTAVGGAVGTVANAAGSFLFRVALGVPLWVWLVGAAALAVYLGLPQIALARLRKGAQ
jgi:hypothetical protein